MALAKRLSSGHLPIAITLVSGKIFSFFDGSVADGKALACGHSYTGNALGCAAAKASLEVFENERVLEALQPKIRHLTGRLSKLGGASWRARSAAVRVYCGNRDRRSATAGDTKFCRRGLYGSSAARAPHKTGQERHRADAATVYDRCSVKASCRSA